MWAQTREYGWDFLKQSDFETRLGLKPGGRSRKVDDSVLKAFFQSMTDVAKRHQEKTESLYSLKARLLMNEDGFLLDEAESLLKKYGTKIWGSDVTKRTHLAESAVENGLFLKKPEDGSKYIHALYDNTSLADENRIVHNLRCWLLRCIVLQIRQARRRELKEEQRRNQEMEETSNSECDVPLRRGHVREANRRRSMMRERVQESEDDWIVYDEESGSDGDWNLPEEASSQSEDSVRSTQEANTSRLRDQDHNHGNVGTGSKPGTVDRVQHATKEKVSMKEIALPKRAEAASLSKQDLNHTAGKTKEGKKSVVVGKAEHLTKRKAPIKENAPSKRAEAISSSKQDQSHTAGNTKAGDKSAVVGQVQHPTKTKAPVKEIGPSKGDEATSSSKQDRSDTAGNTKGGSTSVALSKVQHRVKNTSKNKIVRKRVKAAKSSDNNRIVGNTKTDNTRTGNTKAESKPVAVSNVELSAKRKTPMKEIAPSKRVKAAESSNQTQCPRTRTPSVPPLSGISRSFFIS